MASERVHTGMGQVVHKQKNIVSCLHTNLQVANFQRCEHVFACPCKLVHTSGVHCHFCASSTSGCAFVYFTVQYCIEYSSTVSLFQAQDVQSKHKSSNDVAGTAKRHQTIMIETTYCTVRLIFFYILCLFFMHYLCENYYKPITVQYYIANSVHWVLG